MTCWNHLAWTGIVWIISWGMPHQCNKQSTERYHFSLPIGLNYHQWMIHRPKVISPGFQRELVSALNITGNDHLLWSKKSELSGEEYIYIVYIYIYIYIFTYLHTYIHTYIDTHIHTMLGWQLEAGKGPNQMEVNLIRWDLSLVFKGMEISYHMMWKEWINEMNHQPLFMM